MKIDESCRLLHSMPISNLDLAGNAGICILAENGMAGLTLQAMGDELRMSPQGVRRWFDSAQGVRVAVAEVLARRWPMWLRNDYRGPLDDHRMPQEQPGVIWLLPMEPKEVPAFRAWLSLVGASAHDEALAEQVDRAAKEERSSVRDRVRREGRSMGEGAEEVLLAAARGLRQRVCQHHDPMPIATAREHLLRVADAVAPVERAPQ